MIKIHWQTLIGYLFLVFIVGIAVGYVWCKIHWMKSEEPGFYYSYERGGIALGIGDR
jgi:hypothetical protein